MANCTIMSREVLMKKFFRCKLNVLSNTFWQATLAVLCTFGGISHASVSDQLIKSKSHSFDDFLLANNANLSRHNFVFIDNSNVSFDKRWIRENGRDVSQKYRERTLERYGEELQKQMIKAFEKHEQFTVISDPAEAKAKQALIVSADIEDLNIYGPDVRLDRKHFVFSAGDATLNVEIKSQEGNILAKFKDHRETSDNGRAFLERASKSFNLRKFSRLMASWSKNVVKHVASN